MKLIEILDRPIAFQRPFVTLTGSITAALFLSQAVYWQNRCKSEDGWWYKKQEDWTEETGLSRREIEGARKLLVGIVFCERRGVPAKNHYKVDANALEAALLSLAGADKLDCTPRKQPNKIARGGQHSLAGADNLHNIEIKKESNNVASEALAPLSEHQKFMDWWKNAFKEKFGRDYKFSGGRDGKAVKELLAEPEAIAQDLIDVVKKAWDCQKGFWCSQLVDIYQLGLNWNKIQKEIQQLAPPDHDGGF